jgi:hypothetical protein
MDPGRVPLRRLIRLTRYQGSIIAVANNWRTAATPIALATTSIRTMKVANPDRRVLPLDLPGRGSFLP